MKPNRSPIYLTTAAALLCLMALPVWAQDDNRAQQAYDVTITNLTGGQILSPPIVYSHRGQYRLFTPGEAAIPELASVAEDAASDDLLALLGTESMVADVSIGDNVVMPGESMTVRVSVPWGFRKVSTVGMLVTSNDAFYATTTWVPFPGSDDYALAWDAGSEANTQDCEHIPGPPCGNGGVRVEDGAEGFIYVHTGIQARGDLDPSVHDWRSPVAKVHIRRAGH